VSLAKAAYKGQLALVQFLLAHGADVDAADDRVRRASRCGCTRLRCAEHTRAQDGSTALHAAAFSGATAVLAALLDAGASPDKRNKVRRADAPLIVLSITPPSLHPVQRRRATRR
jgi:ankyrin repeat protein